MSLLPVIINKMPGLEKNHDFFFLNQKKSDFFDLNQIFLDLNRIFFDFFGFI